MVKFVVVGGGVAGVSAAEEISRLASPNDQVVLFSSSRILKLVTNVQLITNSTEVFDLVPTDLDTYRQQNSNLHVYEASVDRIDVRKKLIHTTTGHTYTYDKLCLCLGARPKLISTHPNVIGIRDLHSVEELCTRLSTAKRVMVVGNGGIALELLNEIRRIPLVWVIKDSFLGNTFLDEGASAFFMPHLFTKNEPVFQRLINPLSSTARQLGGMNLDPSSSSSTSSSASTSHPQPPHPNNQIKPPQGHQHITSSLIGKRKSPSQAPSKSNATSPLSPGAALGPVWKTSLNVPVPSTTSIIESMVASDRDLVIEMESSIEKIENWEEFQRKGKKRRVGVGAAVPQQLDINESEDHSGNEQEDGQVQNNGSDFSTDSDRGDFNFIPDFKLFGDGRLGLTAIEKTKSLATSATSLSSSLSHSQSQKHPSHTIPQSHLSSEPSQHHQSQPQSHQIPSDLSTPTDQEDHYPIYVTLSNHHTYGVDFMISATGVLPNSSIAMEAGIACSPKDEGILVDREMRTNIDGIWAAGDCVTANWEKSKHWFQMRLWSQARLMGLQAARSMIRSTLQPSQSSESPSHPTVPTATNSPPHQNQNQNPNQQATDATVSSNPSTTPSLTESIFTSPSPSPSQSPALIEMSSPESQSHPSPPHESHHPQQNQNPNQNQNQNQQLIQHHQQQQQQQQQLPPLLDIHFDLFAHVSRFFGFKVVLLGLFNAQGLDPGSYEIMVRSSHPGEYVKVVKEKGTEVDGSGGKIRGVMLIGETELEELFENLILNESSVDFMETAGVVMDGDLEMDAPLFD